MMPSQCVEPCNAQLQARCGRRRPLTRPRRASHTPDNKEKAKPAVPREDKDEAAHSHNQHLDYSPAHSRARAQAADIKIGAIYDYTGPFAGGGSKAAGIGNKIAIDLINERGGVEGNKIVGIFADSQSKTDVAINEAERLLNEQKVDLIMGVYSSAHCVPMAAKVDAAKKFMWINTCVASAVLKDRKLQYVFRPQVHSDQFGEASCQLPRRERQVEARQGGEGPQGRDHQRGRPLRRRRRDGQRVEVQGARHADRAQGSLFGDRDRSLRAGDQAAPRAARRDPAHRLQSGHHAVPAPGQGSGPQVHGADRPRRRLRPDRQADRDASART